MANTPHSSCQRSSMLGGGEQSLERVFPGVAEAVDGAIDPGHGMVIDPQLLFHCNSDAQALDIMIARDLLDFFGHGGGDDDARGAFVEERDFGAEAGGEIYGGADTEGARFGEGDGESAIAQVMRGFGVALADDFADGGLDALFVIEIE